MKTSNAGERKLTVTIVIGPLTEKLMESVKYAIRNKVPSYDGAPTTYVGHGPGRRAHSGLPENARADASGLGDTLRVKAKTDSAPRGSLHPAGSATRGIVYSGPHYGRTHKILRRQNNLIWVSYQGDTFAVPYCDVEMLPN